MQPTLPGPDSSSATVQPASHSSTSSTIPPATMTINLRNPMVFQPHTEIKVICTSPIKVEFPHDQHLILAANVAATFTVSHRTWISPTSPLDATFARDWVRLPCELRVKVLEYNLTSDHPIRWELNCGSPRTFSLSKTLHAHLAMGPSIADLVPEIIYSRNVFQIDFNTSRILRPPTWANAHTRYLFVRLLLTVENWDTLATFATTTATRLPKLRHVTVQIDWQHPEARFDDFVNWGDNSVRIPGSGFPCPGELVFLKSSHRSFNSSSLMRAIRGTLGLTKEEMEQKTTGAIPFKQ